MQHFRPTLIAVFAFFVLSVIGVHAQSTNMPFAFYLPLTLGSSQPYQPTPIPTQPPTEELSMRREVIRLVNEYRVSQGCPAATEHPALMNGAQAWSDYMRANNYFNHSSTVDGEWYTHRGYMNVSIGVRENVGTGYANAQEVLDGWKNSPNHNRTLLTCRTASTGTNYVYDVGVGLSAGRLWTLALGERLP